MATAVQEAAGCAPAIGLMGELLLKIGKTMKTCRPVCGCLLVPVLLMLIGMLPGTAAAEYYTVDKQGRVRIYEDSGRFKRQLPDKAVAVSYVGVDKIIVDTGKNRYLYDIKSNTRKKLN